MTKSLDRSEPDSLTESDSRYSIDPNLLERVRLEQPQAQFELGKMLYEQHRHNLAHKFLTLALEQGVLEAEEYLFAIGG